MNNVDKLLVTSNLEGDIDSLNSIIKYADSNNLGILILGDILGEGEFSYSILERLDYRWDIDVVLGNKDDLFLQFLSTGYDNKRLESILRSINPDLNFDSLTVNDVVCDYYNKLGTEDIVEFNKYFSGYLLKDNFSILNSFTNILGYDRITPYNLKVKDIPEIVSDIITSDETCDEVNYLFNMSKYEEYENLIGVHAGVDLSKGKDWKDSSDYWLHWSGENYAYDKRNNTGKVILTAHMLSEKLAIDGQDSIINLGSDRYLINNSINKDNLIGGVFNKITGKLDGVVTLKRGKEMHDK